MSNLAEDAVKEHHQYVYDKDRENINYQPYRTTPLITPGAKVKRDNPINSCYLSMHPDPQVRGRIHHMNVNPSLSSMLDQANQQLARKVQMSAGNFPHHDAADRGPRVIHHQFNSPMDMYSSGNAAQSLRDQTGFSTSVDGVKKEFSIQNSQALKAIMEDNTDGGQRAAAPPQKPKSHVVYDLHEAKGGVWPPPGLDEQRSLPPPADRPVRQMVEEPRRELPSSPTQECSFQTSAKTINEKIAQSYSFNKVMWAMDPLERI